ncbi:MAG: Ig-like domain-containing protein [Taibaiella sp.]|nr:Ig-like domain-containing protein [Taibaiella sp.]
MKKIYLSLLVCLLGLAVKAQTAASYFFLRTTGTFTSISGTGTAFSGINSDDVGSAGIPIGFTFGYFGGATTTQVAVCSNGWLSLSNNATVGGLTATTSSMTAGKLAPFWRDGHGGYGGSMCYYQTTGSPGSRVFTFEWNNWDAFSGSGQDIDCQIKLYEGSNIIEFIYGPSVLAASITNYFIGICNSSTDFQCLPSTASTTTSTSFSNTCTVLSNGTLLRWYLCSDPPASTGTMSMCVGGNTTLSNTAPSGTWASSNTGVASVVSGTGVVTGVAAGTARISYIVPGGCQSNVVVTVNAKPTVASITPSMTTACIGDAVSFTAGSVSGLGALTSYNWSGPAGFSTTSAVNNTTLVTSSLTQAGSYSVSVTYPGSGCTSNAVGSSSIVINTPPEAIGGATAVCETTTGTLTNATLGGTWTSATPSVASIDLTSGLMSGNTGGSAVITYTLPNNCYSTVIASVNPLPVVTVTPPGPTTICMGESTSFTANSPNPLFALLSQDFESGLGGWTVSGPAGPANMWQIVTSGTSSAGIPGDASSMLQASALGSITNSIITSPSFSTLGYGSATLTFNEYLLFATPDVSARIEYSVNGGAWTLLEEHGVSPFSSVGGGSWVSTSPETTISLPAGALGQSDVRLRWYYDASQYYWYLDNIVVNAQLPASTYSWTGALGLSCTTCTNPTITPTSTGANNYSITVTTSAGCTTTQGVTVSVNPLPAAISGNLNVCVGTTFTLTNATPGGTWTASNGNVTIGASTGQMTGVAVGNSTITYTLPTNCYITAVATVAPAPSAITGPTEVCEGLTVGLSHAVGGGTWISSNTAAATINPYGVVTGVAAGNTDITYTLPSGCITSRNEIVNATPGAISGTAVLCKGATTTLSSVTPGGNWISSDPSVATITGGGLVTGVDAGNALITYQLPTTCMTTKLVTVNPLPAPITGTTSVCQGAQTVLSNATAGGTWTSSSPVNASVGASTGVVTGGSTGFATVYYTLTATGCAVSTPIIVNALPTTPSGTMEICQDDMSGLSASPAGGNWTSSNSSVISIDPSSGVATGAGAGVATVTYTLPITNCKSTSAMTVNALPGLISGTAVVCVNSTTTLYNFTPGGVWSSGNSSIATISPTGVVTGVNPGMVQIDYTNATTGCMRSIVVTVNAQPSVITGTPQVCTGSVTALGNADGGGTWSSSNSVIASVDVSTGVVTGGVAGVAMITYTLPTTCARTQSVSVNPLPGNISGTQTVCEGATVNWSSPTPGVNWSSDNSGIATVSSTGVVGGVSAGVTTITTTTGNGCYKTRAVTVNVTPVSDPASPVEVCLGQTATLSALTSGGTWSSASPVIAPVNMTTSVVTGGTAGTTTLTYALSTGCKFTTPFTVKALPSSITGTMNVCVNSTTTLSSSPAGGVWTVASGVNASVDGMTGEVLGINEGNETVIYTGANGCSRSASVHVNPLPAPIFGTLNVCQGSNTSLTNATAGGAWSSSAPALATITSGGVATGLMVGTPTITYKLPTGCMSIASLVVNALPADVTGADNVCVGQSITLSNASSGITWTCLDPMYATVSGTGVVTGLMAGPATITAAFSTGCSKSKTIVVNPLPAAIAGNTNICQGTTTILASASPGGTWSSSDPSVASINTVTGAAMGSDVGFSIITYTLPTGCYNTTSLIVNGVPEVITGTPVVCAGSTTQLDNMTPGGTWSASSTTVSINATGLVTGVAAGTSIVTYKTGNNCRRIQVVTVNPLPALIAGTGNVCQGQTMIYSNANPGGTWSSDNAVVADVNATSGVIAGGDVGSANITYTLPTGCMRARMVSVHASVEPIVGLDPVCAGTTSMLSTATTGGIWISSNSTVATIDATTGEVSAIAAGTSVITYAMPSGCTATGTVLVRPLPGNITGAGVVCEGSNITLMSATSGGTWTGSNDAIATVGAAGVVTGVAAGSVTISYTLSTGCMKTRDIVVNPLPMVYNVTGGGSYCAGGAGVAIGLDGSDIGVNYTLTNGTTSFGTLAGSGMVLDFGLRTAAGTYMVMGTTDQGCSANMSGDAGVTINSLVMPSVVLSASTGDSVCAATSVAYTATPANGGTAPTYVWSVAGSPVATGATYTYTPANGDVVTVEMTSNVACPSVATVSDSKSMTVIPNLAPSVSISVGPDDTLCSGSLASFVAVGLNGGTDPVYTWIVGGTIVPGVTGPTYTYMPANNQSVVVKLNSSYRCPSVNNVSSNTITMHIDQQYIPAVSIIADPGTVINAGQTVTFTTIVNGAGPSPRYQWLIRGGIIPGATQATFTSNDLNDGDSVTCVVWGTGRCGMETINSVVMTVNGQTSVATTGLANSELKLMPNPTSGAFVVSGTVGSKADQAVTFEVTDMLGQVVYRGNTVARGGALNERIELTGTLANGMYMLNVSNGTDRKVFHFVLKQ